MERMITVDLTIHQLRRIASFLITLERLNGLSPEDQEMLDLLSGVERSFTDEQRLDVSDVRSA